MMFELDSMKRICEVLHKHFRCVCGSCPPYCMAVTERVTLIHEVCEECECQLAGALESAREEGFFKDA